MPGKQKITTFLWFDGNAEEAVNHYISIFKNSKVLNVARYGEAGPGRKGTVMTVHFQLDGQEMDGHDRSLASRSRFSIPGHVQDLRVLEDRDVVVDRLLGVSIEPQERRDLLFPWHRSCSFPADSVVLYTNAIAALSKDVPNPAASPATVPMVVRILLPRLNHILPAWPCSASPDYSPGSVRY